MLDIKYIVNHLEIVAKACRDKQVDIDLNKILKLENMRKKIITDQQKLLEEKNLYNRNKLEIDKKRTIDLKKKIKELQSQLLTTNKDLRALLLEVPNIPAEIAPIGKSEADNKIVKTDGNLPEFDFPIKNHIELIIQNNWGNFAKVTNIAGARAYTLQGELLLIERALHDYALKKLLNNGFQIMTTPAFANEDAFIGTGHFPKGKDQMYDLSNEKLFLSGTSEIFINSFHANEILKEEDLPIQYGAFGPCFRREAGSAGRDVGGLMRVHQFNKVEQYILCKNDLHESEKWHQLILGIAEEMMHELELPYRIVECCTGDMGLGKYRMNDIEAWIPSENRYRETHSCSTLLDWQARRTNLRYRKKNGKVEYCHTLNCTAVATPRLLIPILEIHQDKDGRVKWPKFLLK